MITESNKRGSIFQLKSIYLYFCVTHDLINLADVITCFALTIVPLPVAAVPSGGITFDDTMYTEYGAVSAEATSPVNIREFDNTDAYSIKCYYNWSGSHK